MGAPQAPGNGWQPRGFLGGATWYDDRKRYEDAESLASYQRGLGAVEGTAKLEDYFKDAPVRDTKRLADIATNAATTATVGNRMAEDVRGKRLDNNLSEGTLGSNISLKLTEAASKQREEGVAKLKQGLQLSTIMMQAMGTAGPAGAAAVAERLKGAGLDVENDPVVRMIMSAGTPQEMQQRAQALYKAFDEADAGFRLQAAKDAAALKRQQVATSGTVAAANARSGVEREGDKLLTAIEADLRARNPNAPETAIKAEAAKLFMDRRYGAARGMEPGAVAGQQAGARSAAELRRMAALLMATNPAMAAQLMQQADLLGGAATPGQAGKQAPLGTPENPINLDEVRK
jgi:hypothetical protein